MADGNDLQLRFGADTSGVRTGGAQVKEELNGLKGSVQTLLDAFLVLGGAASGSFREMRTGAMEAHEQVKGLSESMIEFREAITGIGEALIAAFAVEQIVEFAKKMGEMGEKVEHTALALGMTTTEVQQMQAMANATGMTLDGATGAVTKLERALGTAHTGTNKQSEAFKKLGVDINEARTPAELFRATVAGFAEMPASLEKSQIAMALFGRNLAGVAGVLGLTDEAYKDINRQIDAYGLKNEDAVAQAAMLGRAFNENKNASQGLADVMAQAFAPVLTVVVEGVNNLAAAFIKSYQEGGTAKTLLEDLVTTFKVLATAVATVGTAFIELFDLMVALIQSLIGPFVSLGVVIYDALTGNMKKAGAEVHAVTESILAAYGKIGKASADFASFTEKLWNPPKATPHESEPQRTTGAGFGSGHQKKAADERLQIWKTEFLDEENAHNDMLRNETQDEIDFWRKILATQDVTAKQRVEIERRIAELTHTLKKQAIQEEISDARAAMAEKVSQINAELSATTKAIAEEIKLAQDAARNREISWQQAHDRIAALIQQEVAAQKQAALEIYTARVQADKQIEGRYAQNTAEFKKAVNDEQKAWQDLQNARVKADADANRKISENDRQTVNALRQQWHGYIDSTVHAFGSGVKGMIEGTKSLRDVIADIADSILQTFINIGERMVENWIIDMILNKTTQTTTAVAQVASNAAVAGSGAYAATAMIPFIGPELAPAAAAAAYMGAMSFAPLAVAAGGWGEVPGDDMPTLLHKQEMVLPATLANPLRAMLTSANTNTPSGQSGGGDTHFHYGHQITSNDVSLPQMLRTHDRDMVRWFEVKLRNGAFKEAFKKAAGG